MKKNLFRLSIVGVLCMVGAISSTPAYAYTDADINNLLDQGIARANQMEGECRGAFAGYRGSGGSLRSAINGIGSYQNMAWLSERGRPNTISPTFINWGDQTVNLQVNAVTFLCAPLVSGEIYGPTPSQPANPSVGVIYDDYWRWAIDGRSADRTPNPIGSQNMRPAQTDTRDRIEGFEILDGQPGYISGGIGSVLVRARNDSTRYWFSPTANVEYNDPAGIREVRNLRVKVLYRTYSAYHATSGSSRVEQCRSTAGNIISTNGLDSMDIGRCELLENILTIRIEPRIIYDYELEPYSSANASTVEPGTTIGFNHGVRKTGTSRSFDNTNYAIKRFQVAPGQPIDFSRNYVDVGGSPSSCTNPFASACWTDQSTGATTFTAADTPIGSSTLTVGNLPVGTRICEMAAVDPANQNNARHRWGRPSCVTVGKLPSVYMDGSDTRLGGSFSTKTSGLCTITSNNLKASVGSKGRYGTIASGQISNNPAGYTSFNGTNILLFANSSNPSGSFDPSGQRCMTDLAGDISSYPTYPSVGAPVDLSTAFPGQTTVAVNGDLTIGTSVINRKLTVVVLGNVYITGKITYTGDSQAGLGNLPQLTIVADGTGANGNITVDNGVDTISGIYIAKGSGPAVGQGGSFRTCNNLPQNVSSCGTQLTVNGAVIANSLSLRRTGGNKQSPTESQHYAETFNLSEYVLLSGYGAANNGSQVRTVNEIELPPRY